VLTIRAAAGLLRTATSVADLSPIAVALGFAGPASLLDAEARAAFDLDDTFADVALLRGPGSLRALCFAAEADRARQQLTRAATRLLARAPHGLWVILAVERDRNRVLIGAATPARRGAKVAALIVDRAHVLDSDAETLRQLAASRSPDDLATHARFAEVLGREALTRRFFRQLESCVSSLAESARTGPASARREVALLYASRLLFLGFLESKGWLDDDAAFLTHAFDECMSSGGGFHGRVLLPLFFGTLNTPVTQRAPRAREFGRVPFLNGGLFTRTAAERALRPLRFTDEACGRFFSELLSRFRFTAREETATLEEAAIDPEMLGRAFESLMAADSRRASGAYYTPHELVERVTELGLQEHLGSAPTLENLTRVRVLDPACGSGAFLVHVLDRLADLRIGAGDVRPLEAIRREVLARSIFGVDVNPTAVWLCQLRLWLSIVVDSRDAGDRVAPLPNLDRNVRIGDSLAGPAFEDASVAGGPALRRLRERYARATGPRKATLARQLDVEERRLVIATTTAELERISAQRRDLIVARRGRDLFGEPYMPSREERAHADALRAASGEVRRRIRAIRSGGPLPFAFPAHFADVAADGGFSVIVGNPPWVRPHSIDARSREILRRDYVVARSASWADGAAAAGAGKGFSSQVDLAAVFVERSLRLLSPRGVLSFLLPAKLWRSLSAGGLRQLIMSEARLVRVEDYSDMPAAFDAAVYPGLLVASRDRSVVGDVRLTVLHRSRTAAHWSSPAASIPLDESPGAPWLLLPPAARRSFEMIRAAGTPMSDSPFGRPLLGVKCGFNDAFIVRVTANGGESARVLATNGREGIVEAAALRPVLRGQEVRPWRTALDGDHIVWTHGADGGPMVKLPDQVAKWMSPYRRSLVARSDARVAKRWWSLFRIDAAAADKPRVVWADIGRSVRASVLEAGDDTVPLNTCYVVRCRSMEDALALCVLLNASLSSAWLSVIAEQARGGYRRYLGWTMSLLPIPRAWAACAPALARLGERAMSDAGAADEDEILDAVITAYGLKRRDLAPLIAWAAE
jgi:hypothetical protein